MQDVNTTQGAKEIYKIVEPNQTPERIDHETQAKIIQEARQNHKSVEVHDEYGDAERVFQGGLTDGYYFSQGPFKVAETRGNRSSQEDTYTYGELPQNLSALETETVVEILDGTYSDLNTAFDTPAFPRVGSCSISSLVQWKSKNQVSIYTANQGDSFAGILVLDKNGQAKKIDLDNLPLEDKNQKVLKKINAENRSNLLQLNRLHKPSDTEEKTQIIAQGGKVYRPFGSTTERLVADNLGLALSTSRALGNSGFTGLIHKAEITRIDLTLEEGDKVLVLNTCDGLIDGLSLAQIEEYVKTNDLHKIGEMVYTAAKNYADNGTCVLLELQPEINCFTNINDGNGGHIVSVGLEQQFPHCLSKHMVAHGVNFSTVQDPAAPIALQSSTLQPPVSLISILSVEELLSSAKVMTIPCYILCLENRTVYQFNGKGQSLLEKPEVNWDTLIEKIKAKIPDLHKDIIEAWESNYATSYNNMSYSDLMACVQSGKEKDKTHSALKEWFKSCGNKPINPLTREPCSTELIPAVDVRNQIILQIQSQNKAIPAEKGMEQYNNHLKKKKQAIDTGVYAFKAAATAEVAYQPGNYSSSTPPTVAAVTTTTTTTTTEKVVGAASLKPSLEALQALEKIPGVRLAIGTVAASLLHAHTGVENEKPAFVRISHEEGLKLSFGGAAYAKLLYCGLLEAGINSASYVSEEITTHYGKYQATVCISDEADITRFLGEICALHDSYKRDLYNTISADLTMSQAFLNTTNEALRKSLLFNIGFKFDDDAIKSVVYNTSNVEIIIAFGDSKPAEYAEAVMISAEIDIDNLKRIGNVLQISGAVNIKKFIEYCEKGNEANTVIKALIEQPAVAIHAANQKPEEEKCLVM